MREGAGLGVELRWLDKRYDDRRQLDGVDVDKSLKGMRWTLLKDRYSLKPEPAAALCELVTQPTHKRTPRAASKACPSSRQSSS